VTAAALVAEVADAGTLVRVVRGLRDLGLTRLDALTPHRVTALDALIVPRRSPLPGWTLSGAIGGAGGAWLLLWWINVIDRPVDVGGRPLHAAPMFTVVAFEVAVLSAAIATTIAWMVVCGLPTLWHPLFELDGVERAAVDAFFVVVDTSDPAFDDEAVRRVLDAHGAFDVRSTDGEAA
jgi:hypothetical protein